MFVVKRIALGAAIAFAFACWLAGGLARADSTAGLTVPGQLTNTLQPNCTHTPCFIPYSSSNPLSTIATNYAYTPLSGGQYGLAPTTATALTIPTGATYAVVTAETATVRYTMDGTTPTSTVGTPLPAGASVALYGANVLSGFKAISATGTLDVAYFK